MKLLITLSLTLFAFSQLTWAGDIENVFECRGPSSYAGGYQVSGAPALQIQERLEPVGPMLPAFEHIYYLQVKLPNSNARSALYRLEYASQTADLIYLYDSFDQKGQKHQYIVQHNLGNDHFVVSVPNSHLKYFCSANIGQAGRSVVSASVALVQ